MYKSRQQSIVSLDPFKHVSTAIGVFTIWLNWFSTSSWQLFKDGDGEGEGEEREQSISKKFKQASETKRQDSLSKQSPSSSEEASQEKLPNTNWQ